MIHSVEEMKQKDLVEIVKIQIKHYQEATKLLARIKKDLLMRGEQDEDGVTVVDLSASIWEELNRLLEPEKEVLVTGSQPVCMMIEMLHPSYTRPAVEIKHPDKPRWPVPRKKKRVK